MDIHARAYTVNMAHGLIEKAILDCPITKQLTEAELVWVLSKILATYTIFPVRKEREHDLQANAR